MAFAETFKALSDPVRREILNLLKGGRLTAGEIAGQFEMCIRDSRRHKESDAACTISVMEVPWEEASRFGIMAVDGNDNITEFAEKPKEPKSNLASMGIYIFTCLLYTSCPRPPGWNGTPPAIHPCSQGRCTGT